MRAKERQWGRLKLGFDTCRIIDSVRMFDQCVGSESMRRPVALTLGRGAELRRQQARCQSAGRVDTKVHPKTLVCALCCRDPRGGRAAGAFCRCVTPWWPHVGRAWTSSCVCAVLCGWDLAASFQLRSVVPKHTKAGVRSSSVTVYASSCFDKIILKKINSPISYFRFLLIVFNGYIWFYDTHSFIWFLKGQKYERYVIV